jgi:hypothetical protein
MAPSVVVIGSRALNSVIKCKPSDYDLVAVPEVKELFDAKYKIVSNSHAKTTYRGSKTLEVEWAHSGTSCEMILQGATDKSFSISGIGPCYLAKPEVLVSIYAAHLCFPIQWQKHAPRYWALKDMGFNRLEDLYLLRRQETAERMKYVGSRYDKPNELFFRDSVKREIPHDELHLKLMFHDRPLYERIKRDLSRSGICLDLFENLPREIQFQSVWEEALVLGHERFRVAGMSDRSAAERVMFGLCTNWYPLEFRPFILDNYRELLERFPYYMWSGLKGNTNVQRQA